jgi:hypothetical protein
VFAIRSNERRTELEQRGRGGLRLAWRSRWAGRVLYWMMLGVVPPGPARRARAQSMSSESFLLSTRRAHSFIAPQKNAPRPGREARSWRLSWRLGSAAERFVAHSLPQIVPSLREARGVESVPAVGAERERFDAKHGACG